MNFESLANELLLDIFEYIQSIDLLLGFYNLNHRFNQLILIHFQLYSIDFRLISQKNFNIICQKYLPNITNSIKSLILSNNDDTPQQIDYFFKYNLKFSQFSNLKLLSLYDICSNELINIIIFQLKYLSNLTYLKLAGCYVNLNQNQIQQFIDNIWNLSKLIYCYLNIYFGENNILVPTIKSLSLKYLFIWGIEHNQNEINILLNQTPNLKHFSILFNDNNNNNNNNNNNVDIQTSITKLNIYLSLIEENILNKFFENMFNLTQLTIDGDNLNEILNGYQLENIIRNSLPKLNIFRLRMEYKLINYNQKIIDDLFDSFQTLFWIEEHKWFIRYHWNSTLIYFYTLPYSFNDLKFDFTMKFKSTCLDDKNYFYYNHVNELDYKIYSNLSPIRFLNIKHLSIDLPIDENFWLIVPKLNQITSLNVKINDNNNIQLKFLINQLSHLDSLSLNSSKFLISINELKNLVIRRFDLREYNHYFNNEDIHLLFHMQCEILFLKIENRNILKDLINNMINLRTLIIQCNDDKFYQTNQDEFIIWLKNHMPPTYIISRDLIFHSDIRIWIR